MKVILWKDGDLIITPESDFEETWLREKEVESAFHKTGLTAAHYIGLKLIPKKREVWSE